MMEYWEPDGRNHLCDLCLTVVHEGILVTNQTPSLDVETTRICYECVARLHRMAYECGTRESESRDEGDDQSLVS
jgi:hypothetical protein